jgi:hypothetical protein
MVVTEERDMDVDREHEGRQLDVGNPRLLPAGRALNGAGQQRALTRAVQVVLAGSGNIGSIH